MTHKPAMQLITNENLPYRELKEQAMLALRSGLLPKAIDTPEKAIVIAMTGRELGIGIMQSLTGLYVVNGMVAMKAHLMLRLIYERVPGATIEVLTPPEKASEECEVKMCRPHQPGSVFKYTLHDAKRAGFLSKDPWQKHTSTMLRWAAIRTGARIIFADAIAGCYMEDELPQGNPVKIEAKLEEPELPMTKGQELIAAVTEAVQAKEANNPPKPGDGPTPLDPGELQVPFGKFKGQRLKDRSQEQWFEYSIEIQNALKDPGFPTSQREAAIEVIDLIESYLAQARKP